MPTQNDDLRRALRRAYGQKAGERDQRQIQPWKQSERAVFLEKIKEAGAQTLLEIGAGTGQDAEFFAQEGLAVLATDLTPENVAACRQKGLRAMVMDVCDLQLEAASYDAVFALNCLLHLPKREFNKALENIQRVLKPGGLFYLGQYGGMDSEGVYEDDHYEPKRWFSFFSDDALRATLETYFDVVHFKRVALEEEGLHFQSLILQRP